MQQIYSARNDVEAHFLKGLLEEEGIEVVIQGEALEGAWADLPLSSTALPSLWVKEEDLDRAMPIINEFARREKAKADQPRHDDDEDESDEVTGPTWKCPKCGEEVEEQFDVCWNCGADKPGESGKANAG